MDTGNLKGALFITAIENKATNQSNQNNRALQAYGKYHNSITHFFRHFYDYLKRALLRWPVTWKATISIEASVAIPIVLFSFLEILSLLRCLSVYSGVLYAMKSATDPISMYAYAYDNLRNGQAVSVGERVLTSLIFSEGYLDGEIRKQCNTNLYEQTIKNRVQGISFLGSQVDCDKEYIAVNARYKAVPVIAFTGIEIPMQNYYFVRMWTGYESEANEDVLGEVVYITQTGEVYHTFRDCSHLDLSVTGISKQELPAARNENGERYTNCPMCMGSKEEGRERYYITLSGNKYHGDLFCSALKRTIFCITLEEVGDRKLCERCMERMTG